LKNLFNIVVDENNNLYSSHDGVLYDKNFKELVTCPGGRNGVFSIPSNIESLRDFAFAECDNLSKVIVSSLDAVQDNTKYKKAIELKIPIMTKGEFMSKFMK